MPEGLPFILGFFSPGFAIPLPLPPPCFPPWHLFSAEVSKEGLRGGGGGLTNLRGSGPIQRGLSTVFLLLFPGHSSADFFTPVKAL